MPAECSNIWNKCSTFNSFCNNHQNAGPNCGNYTIKPRIKAPASEITCLYLLIHPTTQIQNAILRVLGKLPQQHKLQWIRTDYRQTMTFMCTASMIGEFLLTSVTHEQALPPHQYTSTTWHKKNKIIKLRITHQDLWVIHKWCKATSGGGYDFCGNI